MKFHDAYTDQVELLLDVAPIMNQFDCFAIKGGTAINLFIQNMPRLSVDIDLTYLPIEPREIFLKNISEEMLRMSKLIKEAGLRVEEKPSLKLMIFNSLTSIKIEPNLL